MRIPLAVVLVTAGALLLPVAAFAESNANYNTGDPTYPGGPIYDTTRPTAYPLANETLATLSDLHHLEYVIAFANNLSPMRRALVLGEIDQATYELEHSNRIEPSSAGAAHPTYESSLVSGGGAAPAYPGAPTYDNSLPKTAPVPFDSASAGVSLRHIRDVVSLSDALSPESRQRIVRSLDGAISDLERGGRWP